MRGSISWQGGARAVALALVLMAGIGLGAKSAPAGVIQPLGDILWDTKHGTFAGFEPNVNYAALQAHLATWGFTVTVSGTSGVLDVNLYDYNLLIVSIGNAWYSPYTAPEVTLIQQWVHDGGGLLIMSDNSFVDPNIDPVANAFGFAVNLSSTWTPEFVTNLAPHYVFTDVTQVYFPMGSGETQATTPAEEIAWTLSSAVVGARQYFNGRVLTLVEISTWDNTNIGSADNTQFAENSFLWLSGVPEPATLSLLALGGLAVFCRKRRG